MDRLAGNYLSNGDVANASSLYDSLEKLNPSKYSRMARICRVLSDPQRVPLPFRSDDICEALLDPAVPPELLLRSCAGDVQKSFQRLAVCVHPDKNPNARAKDAFLRLTHMKDKALQLLRDKAGDQSASPGVASAAQEYTIKTAAGAARRPERPPLAKSTFSSAASLKRRPVKRATPPVSPVTATQAAENVSASLDQLRHTTIKLNCFKRRDIADDFEIFSATQRTSATSAFCSSETSLAECDEEQLAATVPVMPRGRKAPLGRRPQPPLKTIHKQPDGVHRLPTPLPTPVPDPALISLTSPCSASPVLPPQSSPPPPALSPLGETPASRIVACDSHKEAVADGSRPPSTSIAHEDAIRQQIDQTCLRLREMRSFNTNIKLKLDLSFETYQRGKQNP